MELPSSRTCLCPVQPLPGSVYSEVQLLCGCCKGDAVFHRSVEDAARGAAWQAHRTIEVPSQSHLVARQGGLSVAWHLCVRLQSVRNIKAICEGDN
jgi:hypothetical protein